jgi:uncharacterized iron-regulated protein
MKRSLTAAVVLALTSAPAPLRAEEQALDLAIGDPARRDRQAKLVLDGITDSARGDVVTPPELAARLDGLRLLFVGESHTDIEFHKVQLRVIQELHRRGRQVLVGLEMYPTTEQPWLDRLLSDRTLGEQGFVDESHWYRNWGYHWGYYRDIFLFTRDSGIRMFGLNVPRAVVHTMRTKGYEALPPDQKALLPAKIDTDNDEHRQLFRAFFGPEDALHGRMPPEMFEGMFRAQCTWDAAMGANAVKALRTHGSEKAIMVVLAGTGHVAYGLGAERQARLWFDGRTGSLVPVPVADPDTQQPISGVRASYADFVWGVPPPIDPVYPSLGISTPEQKSGERFTVIMVQKGSVAAAAGFEVGDELVSMDGVPIDDKETSNRLMSEKRWGDSALYKVLRGGREVVLTACFRRRAKEPPRCVEPGGGARTGGDR